MKMNGCARCHDRDQSHRLRAPERKLCLTCHEKVRQGIAFVHGPAKTGECLACHDPHKSVHKKLLRGASPDLCWKCHQRRKGPPAAGQCPRKSDEEDCLRCHAPHGGKDDVFYRGPEPKPGG